MDHELEFIRDTRIQEAKGIIGIAQALAKDKKDITLRRPLPPLTNDECMRISKEMLVKYQHIRRLAPVLKVEIDDLTTTKK